jgi:hypothetical protein
MKQNFTVRQGALDGVEGFLSVARSLRLDRARRLARDVEGHVVHAAIGPHDSVRAVE